MRKKTASTPDKTISAAQRGRALPDLPGNERHFFEDVYDVVRLIPKGRVTSYGAIAQYLGSRMSARMVGWAMNASHNAYPPVPAQRVVNRNGMLSGKHHFPTPSEMEDRLAKDGVSVKDDQVVGFREIYWDPNLEIGM
jgi:methylated-DNA-protein-cysteine methyltransferase-like protein